MLGRMSLTIAGAFGAFLACQAPEFIQQYQQNLSGAIGEMRVVAQRFDSNARASGLSREAALQRFQRSGDDFLTRQGANTRQTLMRYEALIRHQAALQQANAFNRLPVFLAGRDERIYKQAMEIYKPALPATIEGALYGASGFFIAYFMAGAVLSLFGFGGRRRRA